MDDEATESIEIDDTRNEILLEEQRQDQQKKELKETVRDSRAENEEITEKTRKS